MVPDQPHDLDYGDAIELFNTIHHGRDIPPGGADHARVCDQDAHECQDDAQAGHDVHLDPRLFFGAAFQFRVDDGRVGRRLDGGTGTVRGRRIRRRGYRHGGSLTFLLIHMFVDCRRPSSCVRAQSAAARAIGYDPRLFRKAGVGVQHDDRIGRVDHGHACGEQKLPTLLGGRTSR